MAAKQAKKKKAKAPASGAAKITSGMITGEAIPLTIKKADEHWTEYTLSDGTVLRVRPIMIEVARFVGKYNDNGDPVYHIKGGVINEVNVPPRLKKKS